MNKIPSEEESDENILVLTDLEKFVLDTFDTVQDPEEKNILERFLSRIKNNKDKSVKEIQKKKFYSANGVFKRVEDLTKKNKQMNLDDLSIEYNIIKEEIRDLKRRIQILETHGRHESKNIEDEPQDDEIVGSIERYSNKNGTLKINSMMDSASNITPYWTLELM